ncbi:MAG: class I SAM-dependent methyltransferase [Phycisphaerae bacterium]
MEQLESYLTCPICPDAGSIVPRPATPAESSDWTALLRETRPVPRALQCDRCGEAFPVTHDEIPVLWSPTLRKSFEDLRDDRVNRDQPTEHDVKAANIFVYEEIVTDYDSEGIHSDGVSRTRLRAALQENCADATGGHLDVGCGAGNTLQAVAQPAFAPKIGLDISLTGLRLTKEKGFHAILGDAEALPLRRDRFALVTASSVLHHLFAPGRLVAEAERVLQRGGVLYTDFDPNRVAANWSWLVRQAFRMRLPVYRVLAKVLRGKVGHGSRDVQRWNKVAEYHNQPGSGFSDAELEKMLREAGMEPQIVLLHNSKTADSIDVGAPVRPHWQHLITQGLSGRNPYARKNCDTVLTVSRKPRNSV